MGLNNENVFAIQSRAWLVFDVETVPTPDCADYLTDPIEAPRNYKDPDKINAYIAEARQRQIDEAALNLDLCEVVAVAFALKAQSYVLTREVASEEEILRGFWRQVASVQRDFGKIVGFNCLDFDLLVLVRRSQLLGIRPPTLLVERYRRHDGIVDVLDVLSFGHRELRCSLSFYCRRFGIPHDESITGADITRLVTAGDWASVARHCVDDMEATRELAFRLELIQRPELEPVA